jgi:hypothetical protein
MILHGGAAAAERARQMRLEEEEMTPYSSTDLSDDWEFKILRSATHGFRDPNYLQKVLEEESQAGWMLVEKFDNGRIRLKRPASARQRDGKLGTDPYRSYAGMGPSATALAIAVIAASIFLGFILLVVQLKK